MDDRGLKIAQLRGKIKDLEASLEEMEGRLIDKEDELEEMEEHLEEKDDIIKEMEGQIERMGKIIGEMDTALGKLERVEARYVQEKKQGKILKKELEKVCRCLPRFVLTNLRAFILSTGS